MASCVTRGTPGKWAVASLLLLCGGGAVLASGPSSGSIQYGKFCDKDGDITDAHEVVAMLGRPGELDAIYEEAARGDARATRFVRELEDICEESARVVAENVSSSECAVLAVMPKCRATWWMLAPLKEQGRGAVRLLRVTQDAYDKRLRELAPQRKLNEAALTLLMVMGPVRAKGVAAKSAGAEARAMGKPLAPEAKIAPAEAPSTAPGPSAAKDFGRLRSVGENAWESPGGLRYVGLDKAGRNRIEHVLEHLTPDPSKVKHGVFNVSRDRVLGLLDEAWGGRDQTPATHDPGVYVVPMGRTVGTASETSIKIVVRPGTNDVITAYPVP